MIAGTVSSKQVSHFGRSGILRLGLAHGRFCLFAYMFTGYSLGLGADWGGETVRQHVAIVIIYYCPILNTRFVYQHRVATCRELTCLSQRHSYHCNNVT